MTKIVTLRKKGTILTDASAKRYFAEQDDSEKGLPTFRKQILKKGEFTHPQFLDETVTIGNKEINLIIDAFKSNAFDKVPILLGTHNEEQIERTVGEILALHKTKVGLDATLEIADELTAKKIKTKGSSGKGLISAVSVSIGPVKTDEGKKFKLALWHVALVTHPHFSNMTDFEELAAMLPHSDVQVLVNAQGGIDHVNAENLDERTRQVRDAFWEEFGRDSLIFSWVQEVHDDFIIVSNKKGLSKYSYTINQDGVIEFGEPERVKVQYISVEAKVSEKNKNKKEKEIGANKQEVKHNVITILAEQGIKFDSVDELKASVEVSDKIKALMTSSGIEENDYEGLVDFVASLQQENKGLNERVTVLETSSLRVTAEHDVDADIRAGKITPVQKEYYIELRISNAELYANLMKDAPVVIDIVELGHNDGASDHSQQQTEEEFQSEKARYTSQSTLVTTNGKDKSGERN